jgi:hypothetical protein
VLDLIEQGKVDGDPQAVFVAIEEGLRAPLAVPAESASFSDRMFWRLRASIHFGRLQCIRTSVEGVAA